MMMTRPFADLASDSGSRTAWTMRGSGAPVLKKGKKEARKEVERSKRLSFVLFLFLFVVVFSTSHFFSS